MSYYHICNASPVLQEIADERERQDDKWGEQNHPDGTGPEVIYELSGTAAQMAASARAECEHAFKMGRGTWLDVLLEEVAEGFAEKEPAKLRAELLQAAAVAVAWVEAIDRRTAAESEEFPPELLNARVKFWICRDHRGGFVEWVGDVAHCLETGCGKTSAAQHSLTETATQDQAMKES